MSFPKRRSFVKWLHWLSAGLILYFFLVEPDLPDRGADAAKTAELSTHAGMGALLGLVVIIWTIMFLAKGTLGRPGPKLAGWSRRAHPFLNKTLHYGLPVMLSTGFATGLSAPFAVMGFGSLPLNIPGLGNRTAHEFAEEIHEIAFNGIVILIVAHAAFHIWRHFFLKDNALKLMAPKILHRYL